VFISHLKTQPWNAQKNVEAKAGESKN